jgi:hypothetical protein
LRIRLRLAQLLAVGFLVAAGCGPTVRPANGDGGAEAVVQDFYGRFGRQKGLAFLSLFTDSARFDIKGLSVSFVDRDGLARLADYGAAVHSRLAGRDLEVSHDTVRCRFDETNDWLGLLGVKYASYDGWFRVSGARIAEARVSLTPQSSDELGGKVADFVVWLRNQDPKVLQRLFPGGRPAYDSDVVPELISMLRQWQSRAR